MAVYTKLRRKRVAKLYADRTCYQDRILVQVWTVLEGESTPTKRFLSDLMADDGLREIFQIVRAQAQAKRDPHNTVVVLP